MTARFRRRIAPEPAPRPRQRTLPAILSAVIIMLAAARCAGGEVPDLSSPQSSARSLYEAAERGDADAIMQVLHSDTDAQRMLIGAYAHLIVSSRRFADAARQRFGGAADAIAQGAFPLTEVSKLDSAVIQQQDDIATIQTARRGKPMTFRRGTTGWRLVLIDPAEPEEKLAAQAEFTRALADVFAQLADDVSAGKFASPQDAETAIQQQINEVMVRAARMNPPTTRPASQPAQQ